MSSLPTQRLAHARQLDRAHLHPEAVAAYQGLLEAHPDLLEGWVDLAGLLIHLGRLPEAGVACGRALRLDSSHYGAQVQTACLQLRLNHLGAAIARFRRAIQSDPDRIAGRLMLSDCLLRLGEWSQARTLLEGILRQDPGHHHALDRRSTLLVLQQDWPALRQDLGRQLVGLTGPEAQYAASHVDLLLGDFEEGWPAFEARLDMEGRLPRPLSDIPIWKGKPLPGATLLLRWEQGFGDTLMFLRYLPRIAQAGVDLILEVQPQLVELAATCPGVREVYPAGVPLPRCAAQASLMSLPSLCATTVETIPADVPYLSVPAEVPARGEILQAVAPAGAHVRIGVCWAGNQAHPKDSKRSLPPMALAPLAALPGVTWFSFQFQSAVDPPLPNLVTLGPLLRGFPNTAFALSQMDLVITVDTVLAHLAGALGIPAFVLLSFLPDWRWMLGRSDSPWYPTLRLYRQPFPGDWDSVIRQVLKELSGDEGGDAGSVPASAPLG